MIDTKSAPASRGEKEDEFYIQAHAELASGTTTVGAPLRCLVSLVS